MSATSAFSPVGATCGRNARRARIALVVTFLNEAAHLPRLLGSIGSQTEPPDQVLLVDDGSGDGSAEIASAFAAEQPYARALVRPRRTQQRDRLAAAPELQAFTWGVAHLDDGWDVVAKVDGDLELSPDLCAAVRDEFSRDPRLGLVGSYLSIQNPDGIWEREQHPEYHIRGANKFYRRACFEEIGPLPAFLGWDTIDELRARRAGWLTRSISPAAGDTRHLRPTGAYDGRLRAASRWGTCAWGYGAHPLWVLLGAVRRSSQRPYVLRGASYWIGWALAAARRSPRAEPELRAYTRREQLDTLWGRRRRVAPAQSEPAPVPQQPHP